MKVKGTETAARQLKAISDRITRRELRLACREGAKVVLPAAKQNCPIGPTGILQRSLGIYMPCSWQWTQNTPRERNHTAVWVGPDKTGWYAHFVEYGTKAHTARKLKRGKLGLTLWRKRKGQMKRGHAATVAKPFLRPAMDENTREVEQAVANHLQSYLNRRR